MGRLDQFDELIGFVSGLFNELRVQISTCSLRACMACLLDRVHHIGDTASLCRREASWQAEVEMRCLREAQFLKRVRADTFCRVKVKS